MRNHDKHRKKGFRNCHDSHTTLKMFGSLFAKPDKIISLIKLWQELGFWTFLVFSKVVMSAPLSLYSELKWTFRDWKELSAQCQLSSLAAVCQLNILQIVSWAAKCQLIGRLSGRWSGCYPLIWLWVEPSWVWLSSPAAVSCTEPTSAAQKCLWLQ